MTWIAKTVRALEFVLLAYCGYVAMHISAITNRYSDGLVGVVHSAVYTFRKFMGTKMCFKKVGVALQRSNACV